MPEGSSQPGNVATAIAILRQRFGDRLQTGEAIRRQHANTITWIPNQPPDAVIWVENRDEVVRGRAGGARPPRADHPVRRRHLARGPHQRAARAASRSISRA